MKNITLFKLGIIAIAFISFNIKANDDEGCEDGDPGCVTVIGEPIPDEPGGIGWVPAGSGEIGGDNDSGNGNGGSGAQTQEQRRAECAADSASTHNACIAIADGILAIEVTACTVVLWEVPPALAVCIGAAGAIHTASTYQCNEDKIARDLVCSTLE